MTRSRNCSCCCNSTACITGHHCEHEQHVILLQPSSKIQTPAQCAHPSMLCNLASHPLLEVVTLRPPGFAQLPHLCPRRLILAPHSLQLCRCMARLHL
jgi:hypothetical protein